MTTSQEEGDLMEGLGSWAVLGQSGLDADQLLWKLLKGPLWAILPICHL